MMSYAKTLLAILVFLGSINGYSQSSSDSFACVFERPLIFGASISAGYKDIFDNTEAIFEMTKAKFQGIPFSYVGSNPGPVTRLSEHYFNNPVITNRAEIVNTMEHSGRAGDQFVAYQNQMLIEGREEESTLIASLDGLYWSTIHTDAENCGGTHYGINGMRRLIQYAYQSHRPILLGSVPDEDPEKVLSGITAGWAPPKKKCLKIANDFLNRECLREKKCYVVDIHKMVQDLKGEINEDDEEGIWYLNNLYSYHEVRADGVHLWGTLVEKKRQSTSGRMVNRKWPVGIHVLADKIERSLSQGPNLCSVVGDE